MAVALTGSFEEGMEKLLPDVLFMPAAVSCASLVEGTHAMLGSCCELSEKLVCAKGPLLITAM